jgi:hypothetical protein
MIVRHIVEDLVLDRLTAHSSGHFAGLDVADSRSFATHLVSAAPPTPPAVASPTAGLCHQDAAIDLGGIETVRRASAAVRVRALGLGLP